jgi:hypothetical protein
VWPLGRVVVIDFSEFKVRINATEIAPELLGEVMVMIAALVSAERDALEARATRVVELVEPKRTDGNSGLLAVAVIIRLMAFDAVMEDHLMKKWLIPGTQRDITYAHGDLLRVAAEEPVVEGPQGHGLHGATHDQRCRESRMSATGR